MTLYKKILHEPLMILEMGLVLFICGCGVNLPGGGGGGYCPPLVCDPAYHPPSGWIRPPCCHKPTDPTEPTHPPECVTVIKAIQFPICGDPNDPVCIGNLVTQAGSGTIPGLIDTQVTVQPNQLIRVISNGAIWSGVWFAFSHGPNGWVGDGGAGERFLLPSAYPYSLVGRIGTGRVFFVGENSGWIQFTGPAASNLFLGINADVSRKGSGMFGSMIELYDSKP